MAEGDRRNGDGVDRPGGSDQPAERPTISVVIPCYNAERYIEEALESVLHQSSPVDEIIVVDDGSTDASLETLGRFGDRVRCFVQDNAGASVARNAGLERATGDIIAFLDADDVWPPDSVATRLAALEANPSAGVVAGRVEQFLSPELSPEETARIEYQAGRLKARMPGTMLVRREVFAVTGGFDPSIRMGESMDWVARATAAGVHIVEIDDVVLRRRLHATNSSRNEAMLKADYLRVLRGAIRRRRSNPHPAPE